MKTAGNIMIGASLLVFASSLYAKSLTISCSTPLKVDLIHTKQLAHSPCSLSSCERAPMAYRTKTVLVQPGQVIDTDAELGAAISYIGVRDLLGNPKFATNANNQNFEMNGISSSNSDGSILEYQTDWSVSSYDNRGHGDEHIIGYRATSWGDSLSGEVCEGKRNIAKVYVDYKPEINDMILVFPSPITNRKTLAHCTIWDKDMYLRNIGFVGASYKFHLEQVKKVATTDMGPCVDAWFHF